MTMQTILRAGVFIFGIAAAGSAIAQTATNIGRSAPGPAAQAAVPVGPTAAIRRQPRVPTTADNAQNAQFDRETPEDEALNRKINGICRGC